MIRIYFLARIMPAHVEERQNNFKKFLKKVRKVRKDYIQDGDSAVEYSSWSSNKTS